MTGVSGLLAGALTGILAAAVALGVAELVAAFIRPQASPVVGVGETAIDHTPPALKNFAVQNFGTHDKLVLQIGVLVVTMEAKRKGLADSLALLAEILREPSFPEKEFELLKAEERDEGGASSRLRR